MADLTLADVRRAMALPGFRLCGGLPMVAAGGHRHFYDPGQRPGAWVGVERWPDWMNPMVAGWLLDLLGASVMGVRRDRLGFRIMYHHANRQPGWTPWCSDLGTACIRAALALGKWPGGVE